MKAICRHAGCGLIVDGSKYREFKRCPSCLNAVNWNLVAPDDCRVLDAEAKNRYREMKEESFHNKAICGV